MALSVFDRTVFISPASRFTVNRRYKFVTYFEGYTKITRSSSEARLSFPAATQAFVLFHDQPGTSGLVLYFPHPAEQRRWFKEDYTITESGGFQIKPKTLDEGLEIMVTATVGSSKNNRRDQATYDAPVFVMSFSTEMAAGLEDYQIDTTRLDEATPESSPRRIN